MMYQMLKPSCCYMRTLVLHVDEFEPNREQRRVTFPVDYQE